MVTSDNSHYSIVKDLLLLLSTKCRKLNPQHAEGSTYDLAVNPHSAITNQRFSGGGEGIRTPDPRVANAVLCQLSYTPDKRAIRGQISDVRTQCPETKV
jgi:hypothetical protein